MLLPRLSINLVVNEQQTTSIYPNAAGCFNNAIMGRPDIRSDSRIHRPGSVGPSNGSAGSLASNRPDSCLFLQQIKGRRLAQIRDLYPDCAETDSPADVEPVAEFINRSREPPSPQPDVFSVGFHRFHAKGPPSSFRFARGAFALGWLRAALNSGSSYS